MSFAIDVNVLLYASDADSPFHLSAAQFIEQCASGRELFCLAWPTIMGYLRITTHAAIFAKPLSPQEAMQNISNLLARPQARVLAEEDGFWEHYQEIANEVRPRGNLVPDAHLAALLRQHGIATLYTHDRAIRRFDFLRVIDPLESATRQENSSASPST